MLGGLKFEPLQKGKVMGVKLLWVERKYTKKSFAEDFKRGALLTIINNTDPGKTIIGAANSAVDLLGVYKSNGVVRTYGKAKVQYES